MTLDLDTLLRAPKSEKFDRFEHHLDGQWVRVLRTLGYDVGFVRAEGPYLFDAEGQRYLDLLSGFGVFAMGRNHPTVIDALEQVLRRQLAGMVQFDVSALAGALGERLCARMPWLEKYFFCNSGAEAVEAAIKFSRAATGRSRIVFCDHGYHGLTYGALSLCGDDVFRERFGPFLGDCVRVPFNDLVALEQALAGDQVAAFVVEPIQGKGVNLPGDDYLPEAARLCQRHGTLLVADEIQTGLGRTGRFLACEHWGVEPDLVCLAKSLSGGFVPVGAVGLRRPIFEKVFDRMERAVVHGSTFSKNDMAMAAGLAAMEVLEAEDLIGRAASNGERLMTSLRARLSGYQMVKEIRGKGMMIAIEFGPPASLKLKAAYALVEQANKGLFCQLILIPLFREHRILAQVAGHQMPVIKLLPPLVIGDHDIDATVEGFAQVIGESQSLGGVWDLGRTLAGHALRGRKGAA